MASSLPVRQGSNRPRETDVDRVRTTSSKDMVQFVLHTGAAQPFTVLVVTASNTYEMLPEDLRLWKSKCYKDYSPNYQYRYYNDANNTNAFQTTEIVPLLHSSSGFSVNRDVLWPNIPSAYLHGVALHLEDIFASVNEDSIYVKITEMMHLLFQGPGKKGRLQDLLPARNKDGQTNILLSWIIWAIRTATSSSQLSFLSILVAHLDSDTNIIEMIDSEDLRKLICNLHVTPKHLLSRLKTEPQLEAFVMEVLKTLDEFHWVYIVLYCYPLFGAQTILNYTSKVNRDRPPSSTCISDTVLPRLNSYGRTSLNTMKIVEKIKQMQEKEGRGSSVEEKVPSAPGKYGKESAISPQTSSSFSHEGTEVTAFNATTSRESALWSKDVSEERSASEKVGEKNVQAESPQAVASSSTCESKDVSEENSASEKVAEEVTQTGSPQTASTSGRASTSLEQITLTKKRKKFHLLKENRTRTRHNHPAHTLPSKQQLRHLMRRSQSKVQYLSNEEGRVPSAAGNGHKESALSPQTTSFFTPEEIAVISLNETTSRESTLMSKDGSKEISASAGKVGENGTQRRSPQTASTSGRASTSLELTNPWVKYKFGVLLESDKATEVHIQLREEGYKSTYTLTIPMVIRSSMCLLNKKWWMAENTVQLPAGKPYKYKYGYTYLHSEYMKVSRYILSMEGDDRELQPSVMEHEDVFMDTSPSVLEKTFIGHVVYELERCSCVKTDNLVELLDGDHAHELHQLKRNIQDPQTMKSAQTYITEHFDSHRSDAQKVFLSRLLGNCCSRESMPSFKKVAKEILHAFQECREVIRPFLDNPTSKYLKADLLDIVVHSLRTVQGKWLHLVQYTYPEMLTAEDLCTYHQSWKNNPRYDCQLRPVPYEDLLSFCCTNCASEDDTKLLRLVFQSNIPTIELVRVLRQHEQSPVFIDNTGYKSWVKSTLSKQILKEESVIGIHEIWKTVAEMKTPTLKVLTREIVLEALTRYDEWSVNAAKSLFSDVTFWETSPDSNLSGSFCNILKEMLKQGKVQDGIDSFLTVVTKSWVTKWSSPAVLETLVKQGFFRQLQVPVKLQPACLLPKIYIFLGTVHSIKWLEGLTKPMDEEVKKFIADNIKLSDLLKMIYTGSLGDRAEIQSHKEVELMTNHAIGMISTKEMTPDGACKLLSPYTQHGQLHLPSKPFTDVISAIVETVSQDRCKVFTMLDDLKFWELIFQAKGENASEIVVQLLNTIQHFCMEMSVSFRIVQRLAQTNGFDKLCKLCQMATSDLEGETALCDQSFKDALEVIDRHRSVLLKKCEKFLAFYEKFPMIICQDDLEAKKKEIDLRWQDINSDSDVQLRNLIAEDYWGVLKPVYEISEAVSTVASSKVFSNMCLYMVEGESCDTEEREPLQVIPFTELVSIKCLPNFRSLSLDIACGCEVVTAGDIKAAFDGVFENELAGELNIISRFIDKSIGSQSKVFLTSWVKLERIRQYAKQLQCLFRTFEVPSEVPSTLIGDVEMLLNIFEPTNAETPLQQVHLAVKRIEDVDRKFTVEDWTTIDELINSEQLIQFLRPILDDDLRNITDAVEERFDSVVNESTVSDLIEVQRYMGSFLRVEVLDTPDKLIDAIAESKKLGIKKVSDKIKTCNDHFHALKNLYNNIAQRKEMTKKIIRNAIRGGSYTFLLKEGEEICNVSMSYEREDKSSATFEKDDLNDLRSRALLMVNSKISHQPDGKGEGKEESMTKLFQEFIRCVDEVIEIVGLCSGLASSGHYLFKSFQECVSGLIDLLLLKQDLKTKSDCWTEILELARGEFYFLNFYHSKQLWVLDQFFGGEIDNNVEIVNLFHYVSPGIVVDSQLIQYYEEPDDLADVRARVFQTGRALDKIFSNSLSKLEDIKCLKSSQRASVDNTVQPGNVYVAELDTNSTNSVPVLMTLLKNTKGKYPQANQVLFCHTDTAWEEVYLLLQRCRNASKRKSSALYALINVEQLTTEVQFRLVDEVKELQQDDRAFLLVIICCGGSHHHIIDQFSPHFTHQIQGMTTNEMRDCLEQRCPNVEVITSEVPGLGKSEYIACKAAEKRKRAILFEIGGPLTKTDLVRQLLQKSPSEYQALHIDIRSTFNPKLVDSFIFELLVVGMVVAGTHLCELRYSEVFIEIANDHKHHLRDCLINCCNFKRHHIEWDNYSSFLVSQETNSPVQAVCHYLKAVKDGVVDSKEIHFTGPLKDDLLSDDQCRQLLRDNFSPTSKMAFTTVNMFLNVLATELKKMSASHYFNIEALRDMLGTGRHCVRSDLFKALGEVAREFSSRSVESSATQPLTGRDAVQALSKLQEGPSVTAEKMVERVKGMVQWADRNHLMVVFNQQDTQTCSTLYRSKSQVPNSVKNLFEKQLNSKLPDYQLMSQAELQTVLERISRTTLDEFDRSKLGHLNTLYALTPDNMIKMVLIHMRVKSRVPVVIMGETGCGKTTLITYLARICEVPFHVQNFHAGVSKDTIIDFIAKMQNIAEANLNQQIWCFLDEINTCDHLGLLSEIICHHTCLGEQLPYNLVFIAACNPYLLRKGKLSTSGLSEKLVLDEQSKLVYRVHPLPEALMDYVWDYGALNAEDEKAYTERMVSDIKEDLIPLFLDLLIMSQRFIRSNMDNKYCVSLRDIDRCKYLAKWMTDMLIEKGLAKLDLQCHVFGNDSNIRAIVLALAHCYHSRLSSASDRKRYREEVAQQFKNNKYEVTESQIEEVIKNEQLDILNRMELEEGIAKNEALRENVFVVLISILNRIPVFLVGKPGCSKSLSMQLIRSNLRGPDSKDKYFKTLPAVYVVSYQGSESSTSEGIIKVFEKAKRYKEANSEIIPVVLLDEIGLAENSFFNPLKVLHGLLEPSTGDFPEMAVVGISNWALDAAKMNRAVHLSRPEPNEDDLFETAKAIRDESAQRTGSENEIDRDRSRDDQQLKKLAKAYYDYQHKQTHVNFHGLRDYYSLIKSMAMPHEGLSSLESGLRRNFGGIRSDMPDIMDTFMKALDVAQNPERQPSALDLIKDNLEDKHARHLMLITSGDSALSIIEKVLFELNKKPIILLGSRFDDDISEDYNYRILSRIILCMEEGYVLVLRDLENVYSSLYDMLNQNYTLVCKKRHCRVALGAFSNPMCQVHSDFRCIVIVDQQNIDYSDPPLLNRFEKQTLTFMDIVSDEQKQAIDNLRRWVEDMSTVEEMRFTPSQAFLGYHNDTLSSLVAFRCQEMSSQTMDFGEITDACKQDLLKIASADAVLRATKSKLAIEEQDEVRCIQKKYLDFPLNSGLKHYLRHAIFGQAPSASLVDGEFQICPCKLIVYTYCTMHVNLTQCVDGLLTMRDAKLSQFKSERQLTEALRRFCESSDQLFILQCKTSLDAHHMLLAKCQIDKCLEDYRKAGSPKGLKHACFIVHVERDQNSGRMTTTFPWQFNFLCGWQQVTLDSLEQPKLQVDEVIKMSISDICAKSVDIESVIQDKLLWCFSCISYDHRSKSVDEILQLIRRVTECPELLQCLSTKILDDINEEGVDGFFIDKMSWQVDVACEVELLFECASFIIALIEHVKRRICWPLFKIVFFLEENNAWDSYLNREECKSIWESMLMNSSVCDVRSKSLPDPKGIESCKIDTPVLELSFPFFHKLYILIEDHMRCLHEDAEAKLVAEQYFVQSDEMNVKLTNILNGGLPEAITYDMTQVVDNEFLLQHIHSYLKDLCNIFSSMYVSQMPLDMRINTTKLLVQHQVLGLGEVSSANEKLSKWHIALFMNSDLLAAQLQLLQIYHLATGNDSMQKLVSVLCANCKKNDVSILSRENGLDPLDVEQSETSEDFVAASDELPDDLDSDDESVVSSLESYFGETDGGVSLGGKTEESSLKFQLVSSVCQSLLPITCILEKFNGQESWVRCANTILLSAASIGVRPRELHYLHFCKDFVNLLALPSHLPDHFLARLGELIDSTEEVNVLDSEEILRFVKETIKYIQQQSSSQCDSTEHHLFLSKYFGRCIDANVETPLMEDICRSLVTDDGRLIEGSQLVMWRILRSEIDDTDQDTVFTDLIHEGVNQDRHSENLVILDNVLQNQPDGLNFHFATLCCDLIGDCGFCNLTSHTLTDGHSRFRKTSLTANQVVATSAKCSLKLVCAVTFLSKLFRVFAEIFTESAGDFPLSRTEFSHIRQVMPDFLGSSEIPVDIHKWILRYLLHRDTSLFHLSEAVSSLSKSDVLLQKIDYQSLLRPVIGYSPMNYMEMYSDVRDAFAQLNSQGNIAGMEAVITRLESSPKHRLALMAVLVDYSYLVTTTRDLSESQKSQAQRVINGIEDTNLHRTSWYYVIRGISGVSDFKGILQLSKKSKMQDAQLASVLMHLATLILGSLQPAKGQSIFQQLFSSQAVAKKGIFFPGSQKQSSTEDACTRTVVCHCGLQFVQDLRYELHQKCPTCGYLKFGITTPDENQSTRQIQRPSGYSYPPVLQLWNTLQGNNDMSIASQLVTDFMVHGCLYVAAEVSPGDFEKVSFCAGNTMGDRLLELWSILPMVLRANSQDTSVLLHCIIKESSEILVSPKYTSASASDIDRLEMEIHNVVEKVLQNSTLVKLQFLKDSLKMFGTPTDSIHYLIHELDNIDDSTSTILQRSSRNKREPSLEDLRACFCDHSSNNSKRFPFLHLVLSRYNALKYIAFLPTLMRWNLLLSSHMNLQRATHKYGNKRIRVLLDAQPNMSEPWSDFMKAFNEVCARWTELTGETALPEDITLDSQIKECLMPKVTEENTLKRMIKTLQEAQNSFLMQALSIAATTDCAAISFLVKDSHLAAAPTKPLNMVKEKDVISPPSDGFLCYHDINTAYGHGTEISYDLNQIEMDVALNTVLNKVILTDGSTFEGFVFADDLYSSSTSILNEVAFKVRQEPLPNDIVHLVIQRDKKKHGSFTNDLLQTVEVLMGLLKRTRGDPEATLEDFISKWSSFIAIKSADLLRSIKLKHIVALYHRLEVLLSAAAIQTLGKEYRTKLPVESEHKLDKCCSDYSPDVVIQLRDILKRFVFRYLRPRQDFHPNCSERLRDILGGMTEYDRVIPLLHKDTKLCHIVYLLEYLDKTIKHKEEKAARVKRKGGKKTAPPIGSSY